MTWSALNAEVQQVFHELMGYEEYQQDLFTWLLRDRAQRRALQRDAKELQRKPTKRKQVHHCCECGESGHRGRWRGEVICVNAAPERRAA